MSPLLTPRRLEGVFWLLLWLGLAIGIGVELDWGRKLRWPVGDTRPETVAFARPVLSQPFSLAGSDQFRETTARPIFVVTRRPAPPAPPSEPPRPSMQKDQFILTGTAIVPEGKLAFLLEKAGNKSRVVAEGRDINGIRLMEVAPDRVVLGQNGDTEILVLKTIKQPPGRVANPPGTPAGSRPGAAAAAPASSGMVPPGAVPPATVPTVPPATVPPGTVPPTAATGAEAKQQMPQQRRLPTPPLQVPARSGGAAQVPPQPQPAGPAQ